MTGLWPAALLLALGGCAHVIPMDCEDAGWGDDGLTCDSVSAAVRPALGTAGAVSRLSAAFEMDCPSGGTCPPAWGTVTVTAHRTAGDPLRFLVSIGNDGLVDVEPISAAPGAP